MIRNPEQDQPTHDDSGNETRAREESSSDNRVGLDLAASRIGADPDTVVRWLENREVVLGGSCMNWKDYKFTRDDIDKLVGYKTVSDIPTEYDAYDCLSEDEIRAIENHIGQQPLSL
jgi:hypothetical protein